MVPVRAEQKGRREKVLGKEGAFGSCPARSFCTYLLQLAKYALKLVAEASEKPMKRRNSMVNRQVECAFLPSPATNYGSLLFFFFSFRRVFLKYTLARSARVRGLFGSTLPSLHAPGAGLCSGVTFFGRRFEQGRFFWRRLPRPRSWEFSPVCAVTRPRRFCKRQVTRIRPALCYTILFDFVQHSE